MFNQNCTKFSVPTVSNQHGSNTENLKPTLATKEMVGNMLRVTLNFDLSKIPFVHF